MNTFSDVIEYHNTGMTRLNQSEYNEKNWIANILKNDKKMRDIFLKLNGNKDHMTMVQYVSAISQLKMRKCKNFITTNGLPQPQTNNNNSNNNYLSQAAILTITGNKKMTNDSNNGGFLKKQEFETLRSMARVQSQSSNSDSESKTGDNNSAFTASVNESSLDKNNELNFSPASPSKSVSFGCLGYGDNTQHLVTAITPLITDRESKTSNSHTRKPSLSVASFSGVMKCVFIDK